MSDPREPIGRRTFLNHVAVVGAAAAAGLPAARPARIRCTARPDSVRASVRARGNHGRELQAGMTSGRYTSRRIAEQYLARIAAMDRAGPALQSVIETNPDALDHRRRARPRAGVQGPARPAARHPRPAQGQHRHRRPDDDDGRLAGARGSTRRATRTSRERLRAAGAVILGQDEPERVGQHPLDPLDQRLERARRPVPQPVRPRPQSLRLELRVGRGGRRPTSAPSPSAPRPTAPSSARRRPTASSASSRRWGS